MSTTARSKKEIELHEQKLAAEIKKIETETKLTAYEVQEYQRQERNAKAKNSEARVYNFVDQVSTNSVKSAIGTLTEWVRRNKTPITIVFNSPGGNVFAGLALYDAIKVIEQEGIEVTTVARGMAASMAGILLQAGNKRVIGENAYILIHEVSDLAVGTTTEIEDELKLTKRLQKRLVNILAERATIPASKIEKEWKRKDWWLDAAEAVELGFADAIG